MEQERILVIEDDPEIFSLVNEQANDLGYLAVHIDRGPEGLEAALTEDFALVVVDLKLPGLGGLEICSRLRSEKPLIPIVILTGEQGEVSTVVGLELGADEYIQKPVRKLELRARMKALLRRAKAAGTPAGDGIESTEEQLLSVKDLLIDCNRRQVKVGTNVIDLTSAEFDILALLAGNPNRAFSREAILSEIWGEMNYSQEQNIRTHISRIRQKLELRGKRAPYIVTRRGFGYIIASDEDN